MTKAQKARLLEWSGRCFMMTYAGLGVPQLRLDYLCSHRSKLGPQGWPEVFERATRHADDGHSKYIDVGLTPGTKVPYRLRHVEKPSECHTHFGRRRAKG